MRQPVKRQEIFETLRRRILSGELAADTFLPSEPALSAEFGVARETMRGALGLLENSGFIERIRPRGTRVLPCRAHGRKYHAIGMSGFTGTLDHPLNYHQELLDIVARAGYELVNISYSRSYLERHPSVVLDMPLDGIFFAGSMISPEIADLIRMRDKPVTTICITPFAPELDWMDNDHRGAARIALDEFERAGHRRIGGFRIHNPRGYEFTHRDEQGVFKEVLGRMFDPKCFLMPENATEMFARFGENYRREMVRAALEEISGRITAVYLDYQFAVSARDLLASSGLDVVCYSEYPVDSPAEFPVVCHDRKARLCWALERLIDIIQHGKHDTQHHYCRHYLQQKGT